MNIANKSNYTIIDQNVYPIYLTNNRLQNTWPLFRIGKMKDMFYKMAFTKIFRQMYFGAPSHAGVESFPPGWRWWHACALRIFFGGNNS